MKQRLISAKKALQNRIWMEDFKLWENEKKPYVISQNKHFQSINISNFTDNQLLSHVNDCWKHLNEMSVSINYYFINFFKINYFKLFYFILYLII